MGSAYKSAHKITQIVRRRIGPSGVSGVSDRERHYERRKTPPMHAPQTDTSLRLYLRTEQLPLATISHVLAGNIQEGNTALSARLSSPFAVPSIYQSKETEEIDSRPKVAIIGPWL